MADMRRRSPEPPPGPPEIQFKPGIAKEMLRELAPLLAEEGIDVDNIDVPDLDTLQAAMNRAVERQNTALFTPVGQARDRAVVALRLGIEAIADGDTTLVALDLLDEWLSGRAPNTPADLAAQTRLPAGHWVGERAATDILVLARKGRAFRSLDTLITQQGGQHVLYGSALALAAATHSWSRKSGTPIPDLTRTIIR